MTSDYPSPALPNLRGVIFDIDGVLTFQGQVYPGAVQVIERLKENGLRLRFLTNSTLKSRASCAAKLIRAGFQVEEQEVITASYATAVYLRGLKSRSCWVMVEQEGIDEFRDFVQDTENPEVIVIGDNRSQFDFDHLNKALRLLKKGARLVAMQYELLDTSMGDLELNVGSWVRLLEQASGVQAVRIGKPSAFAFELALGSMGLERHQVVVVGDRISTDVAGAQAFGLRSVLVKSGEYDERDLQEEIRPDYVIDSIQDLPSLFRRSEIGRYGEQDKESQG